ncbi:MAG: SRPBCC family protein [Myxococcota bacterium]
MPDQEGLDWPAGLRPGETPIYTRNELAIPAAPERVWAWLIRAGSWPAWYANCRNVKFLSKDGPDLGPGTVFAWTTFGVRVKTTVREFTPSARLAWEGGALGGRGYHGWIIEKTGAGCRVITEETQRGLVPSVGRLYLRRELLREHEKWLEGLSRMAQGGLPADPPS